MRVVLKERTKITDMVVDAIADAEEDGEEVLKIYLSDDEYDRFIHEMRKSGIMDCQSMIFMGIDIARIPEHDLFHDGEYWVKVKESAFDFSPVSGGLSIGVSTGTLLTLDGKLYRKVTQR